MEDHIHLNAADSEMQEYADAIESVLPDDDSPHGSGELGQDDLAAREIGYDSIEDQQNVESALIEEAERELGRELDADEIDTLLDEIRADRMANKKRRGEEEDGDDEAEYDDDDEDEDGDYDDLDEDQPETDPEQRRYSAKDIIEELGEDAVIIAKVDGEEIEVPVSDLVGGYQRQASYTKKTQALAEERKIIHEQADAVRSRANDYMQRLAIADQLLRQAGASEEQIAALGREMESTASEAAQHDAAVAKRMAADEAELLVSKIPEWRDQSLAKAERDAMLEYALNEAGFTREDLASSYDHRAYIMLRKAMLYDRAVRSGRIKPVTEKRFSTERSRSKVVRPGKSKMREGGAQGKKQAKRIRDKSARLKQTGRVDDAASLFFDILPDDV